MRDLISARPRRLQQQSLRVRGRKAVNLALVGLVFSLLTACTSGGAETTTTAALVTTTEAAVTTAAATATTTTAAVTTAAAAPEPIKVRVGIVPATTWLPIIVAKEAGIFEEHGLDVEITPITAIADPGLGNQYEIIQNVGPNVALAVLGGIDEVLISNVAQEGETTTAVMTMPDSGITSIADLAGKRIGVAATTSAMAQGLLVLMDQAGLSAADVTFQETPFPTMADQLSGGQVDAIVPVEPFASQAEAAGAVRLVNPILEGGSVFSDGEPVIVGFTTSLRSWAEENPGAIDAWRESLTEAIEFIAADEAATRAIFQEFTGLPEPIAQTVPFYVYDASPTTPEQLQVWIDILVQNGEIAADHNLDPASLVLP